MKAKILGLLVTIASVATITPAKAADYRTFDSKTFVNLNETGIQKDGILPPNTGSYRVIWNGVSRRGYIKFTTTKSDTRGNKAYSGTFDEYGAATRCTGTIKINKTLNSAPIEALAAEITSEWTVGKSGFRCPLPVGKKFTAKLQENLPSPNSFGDYPGQVTDGTFDLAWDHPTWKVVDRMNLNCRQVPNGKVVKTFPYNQTLNTASPINQFKFDRASKPWIYISDSQCYVRHNARYLSPIPQAY